MEIPPNFPLEIFLSENVPMLSTRIEFEVRYFCGFSEKNIPIMLRPPQMTTLNETSAQKANFFLTVLYGHERMDSK